MAYLAKTALGVEVRVVFIITKILYFSAAISADAMHSQIDIPRLVEEYAYPEGVETVNLGAWNNHPTVIAAIKARIDEQLITY